MRLMRLIYVSEPSAGYNTRAVSDNVIDKARELNQIDGITGMLMVSESHFIQVIEGESARLSACFSRIQHDARHQKIEIMEAVEVHERHFADWSMFYGDMSKLEPSLMKRFSRGAVFDPREMNALSLLLFLSSATASLTFQSNQNQSPTKKGFT
jgi:hypothetical protein